MTNPTGNTYNVFDKTYGGIILYVDMQYIYVIRRDKNVDMLVINLFRDSVLKTGNLLSKLVFYFIAC